MKKYLVGIFVIVLLGCTACNTGNTSEIEREMWETKVTKDLEEETTFLEVMKEEEKEKAEKQTSLFQIKTDTQTGTGILWDKQESIWVFITASHVIDNNKEVEIIFEQEYVVTAQATRVKGLDLAFLWIDANKLNEVKENYMACLPCKNDIDDKETVFIKGFRVNGKECEYQGKIINDWIFVEDFDNYMLLCEGDAEPGMSGGGVFSKDGELMGMICAKNNDKKLVALPISVIESEYGLFHE